MPLLYLKMCLEDPKCADIRIPRSPPKLKRKSTERRRRSAKARRSRFWEYLLGGHDCVSILLGQRTRDKIWRVFRCARLDISRSPCFSTALRTSTRLKLPCHVAILVQVQILSTTLKQNVSFPTAVFNFWVGVGVSLQSPLRYALLLESRYPECGTRSRKTAIANLGAVYCAAVG